MTWARKAGERLRAMRSDEGAVEAVIALVRWMRGDRVERPWRLTRRQRVEMEAALMALRGGSHDARHMAPLLPVWTENLSDLYTLDDRMRRDWARTLRARIAIALRAALRADEDALCEEVRERIASAHPYTYEIADYMEGTDDGIDALREWPATVSQTRDTGVRLSLLEWAQRFGSFVPDLDTLDAEGREEWTSRRLPVLATAYALWERRPSLWAQSPPTSDARGPFARHRAARGETTMTDKTTIEAAAEKAGQEIGRGWATAGGDASPDPDYDFSGDGDWQHVREVVRAAAGADADEVWEATDPQPAREWYRPIWDAVESGYRSAIEAA